MKKLLYTLLAVSIIFSACKKEEETPTYNNNSALAIGDTHQGGIIFYFDGNGGGLVAAISDQSSGGQLQNIWGCSGTNLPGADGTAIGTGFQNTIDIIAGCTTSGTVADICANLNLNGYSDWFLPSRDELNLMWTNLADSDGDGFNNGVTDPNNLGGFASTNYWSSTEYDDFFVWHQNFTNGYQGYYTKFVHLRVRAVRAF